MRLGRLYIAGMVICVLGTADAAACSCSDRTFEEHFRKSDLVFEGVAVRTRGVEPETLAGHFRSLQDLATTFRVTGAIKGVGPETREIRHHIGSSSCGMGFKIGTAYRVYAHRSHGKFYTNYCTRTGYLVRKEFTRKLRTDSPEPGKTLGDVVKQIRNLKLDEDDAEWLVYEFRQREEEEKARKFIRGYIARAESAVEQAADGRIGGYSGALAYAKFYEGWNDYERAAEMYALVEKVAPEDARGPAGQGRAFFLADRANAAVPHLERALRLDADHPEAATFLARARLVAEGKLTRGVIDYRNIEARTLDLDGAKHPGINLSGGRIGELSARDAYLREAILGGVTTEKADFQNADLSEANFVGARISGGDFTGAKLKDAYAIDVVFLDGVQFRNADLSGIQAMQAEFQIADLRGVRLQNANFAGAGLHAARLTGVSLKSADFSKADLTNARLQGADLRGAVLEEANVIGARIDCETGLPDGLDVRRAGLIPVSATCDREPQNRDFSNRTWESADFSGLDLRGASFADAEFDNAYGRERSFLGANLQDTDFSGTSGIAEFSGADLTGADFSKSEIKAVFNGLPANKDHSQPLPPATLKETDFTRAKLETSSFIGELYSPSPIPEPADYSAARFDKAQFKCSFGDSAERIERKVQQPQETVDPSKLYGPFWDEISEIERKRAREDVEALYIREAAERKRQAALVEAERKLVTFLREKWPSVTFGKSCRYYLARPEQSATD